MSAQTLDTILSNLAVQHAAQTAATIREFLGELLGAAAPPAPAPVKRKLGRPAKASAPTPAALAPAAPTAKTAKPKVPKARPKTYSDAEIARTLEVIKAKPGLLPSQYRVEAKVGQKAWDNLIYRLKTDKKIKVTGGGRKTTYVLV